MWLCLWIALLTGESQSAPVDFETQVMPILTKAGCNTGACHGAAAGRGGFSLSLYGSRPAADFVQITLALEGRRIDRQHSEMVLLLLKPTEQLSHEGGEYQRTRHCYAQASRTTSDHGEVSGSGATVGTDRSVE